MPREELRQPDAPVVPPPRGLQREMHSDATRIEQKPTISDDPAEYDGDIVLADQDALRGEYAAKLAFMEEPVTIRIEPSTEKHAPMVFPVWVNGKGAEVFQNGRWMEIGYLPVAQVLTVRRKVLEVILRAKVDTLETVATEAMDVDRGLGNAIRRFTSPVHSFSVLEDKNPRGPAWLGEMRRRNF